MTALDLKQPRFVLGPRIALIGQQFSETTAVVALTPGIRVRFNPDIGLIINGDIGIGAWSDKDHGVDPGDASLVSLRAQVTPFFNPGGGFYFGPTAILGRTWYSYRQEDQFGFFLQQNRFQRWNTGVGIRLGSFLSRSKRAEAHFEWVQSSEDADSLPFGFQNTELNVGFSVAF